MQNILSLETNKYAIKVENFEGPLDLLCHLIDKNKMSINDIKISEITDQYLEYIRQMVPNITVEILKKIKLLQPGTCIAFGSGFKLPSLIKLEMPNPAPSSNSCNISDTWFIERR